MYEDTPQELVHDLFSEAVFGEHPLGRPVIGTREVISIGHRAARSPRYHRSMYVGGNIVVAAAGNLEHDELVGLVERAQRGRRRAAEGRRACAAPLVARAAARRCASSARTPSSTTSASARPGISRSDRAPLRRVAPRRDPRRLRVVAALPGDPREARDGVRRLQLRVAVHGHRARSGLRRHARGQPRRVPRDRGRSEIADIAAGNLRPNELERAKENLKGRIVLSMESTSNRMSRLGKSLDHRHRAALARPRDRRDRRGRAGRARGARRGAARARAALGGRDRPGRGAVPRRGRARQSRR